MPIIKSAKKRVKVAAKATIRNGRARRNLRDALKEYTKALQGGKEAEILKAERAALSAIDQAAKKAVIHKNKAARKKAQIAAQAKASR
jgi:small subunit ribosomal protein S20